MKRKFLFVFLFSLNVAKVPQCLFFKFIMKGYEYALLTTNAKKDRFPQPYFQLKEHKGRNLSFGSFVRKMRICENLSHLCHPYAITAPDVHIYCFVYSKNPSKIPAATAEPITPATFGPIACISR